MVANLVVDVLVINRFLRKATGLSTFSDESDTSEITTDHRAVETAPNPHSDHDSDGSRVTGTNSTSLGTIDFTPVSTAIHTESQVSQAHLSSKSSHGVRTVGSIDKAD